MKHLFSFLLLFCMTAVNAQTILKGDMNDDKDVNIADVTSLVDVVLGKAPKETIGIGSPYMVDNSYVVGTWYAPDGTSFTLNEDGTTDFGTGFTYKFRPYQGTLMMFNASGAPVKTFVLNEVESAYLLAIDYATGAYTYYTNSGSLASGIALDQTTLAMNSGTTAQLTATLLPEGAFGSVTWMSSDENVATVNANGLVTAVAGGSCTITATAGGSLKTAICSVTVTQLVTSIVLSQTTAVLELDAFVRLTATVLPENAANMNVVWSSSNDDVAPVKNGRIDAYGYGNAIITCEAADGSGVKATCRVNIPLMEYVDLGLPSGTLWATCNIGAYSPEEYGSFFAWGETEGTDSGKTYFSFGTYKWCENGSSVNLTKYCTRTAFGTVDGKGTLDLEDDAAYINWGPSWQMPSRYQFEELINNSYTTTEYTSLNGVNGYKITSNMEGFEGNSIFFPSAGLINGYSHESSGNYWSNTLYLNTQSEAYHLFFTSSEIKSRYYYGYRAYGRSVRPVRLP